MNLAAWKAKWYPVPAHECSAEGAIDHSILKWTGLLPENRMGLKVLGSALFDSEGLELEVNSDSCALCAEHLNTEHHEPCMDCPLSRSRGDVSCDRRRMGEAQSPWNAWASLHEPGPMLEALHKAKAWVLEQAR